MGLEDTRPPAKWTGGGICIVNSDGCAVFGTSWERAVFGCRGLQPSEFVSPAVQIRTDSGRSVANRAAIRLAIASG